MSKRNLVIVIGFVVFLLASCCLCLLILGLANFQDEDVEGVTPMVTVAPSVTPVPTATQVPMPTATPQADMIKTWQACKACQGFVKEKLVAPATASFQSCLDVKYGWDWHFPERWVIAGYVDAQNRMGALIRGHYECTVRLVGDEWHLEELELDDHIK